MKKNMTNQFKQLFAFLAIPAIALFLLALSEKECAAQNSLKVRGLSMNTAGQPVDTRTATKDNKPLFLLDGEEASGIENINPEDIHSVSVIKDNNAIDKYGEKAKNGVVLITTKAYAAQHAIPEPMQIEQALQQAEAKENLSASSKLNDTTDRPFIMVDGEEVSGLENISPDDVDTISVLKDRSATERYGEKGKNGAILITTKKGKE